jgi:hypothetical protein
VNVRALQPSPSKSANGAVIKDVDYHAGRLEVAPFQQHRPRAHFDDDPFRRHCHGVLILDWYTDQNCCFMEVRRHQRRLGHEVVTNDFDRLALEQNVSGCGHHHRVEHVVGQ